MILEGDARVVLRDLPDESVDCVVTSPPYWGLRDYGSEHQIGHEPTPQAYVSSLADVFDEIYRVLKSTGTLWLNIGDSYASVRNADKPATYGLTVKDLVGIPWRVAFALQDRGWILRQDIIWAKPNPMPESVTDRCTKAHEYVFLFSKSARYHFDASAISEPAIYADDTRKRRGRSEYKVKRPKKDGHLQQSFVVIKDRRNKRSVWQIPTRPFPGAHFAVMPEALVEPCILAGCPSDGVVLDPFFGSGTVGVVALKHGRRYIGVELNSEYISTAQKRIEEEMGLFL